MKMWCTTGSTVYRHDDGYGNFRSIACTVPFHFTLCFPISTILFRSMAMSGQYRLWKFTTDATFLVIFSISKMKFAKQHQTWFVSECRKVEEGWNGRRMMYFFFYTISTRLFGSVIKNCCQWRYFCVCLYCFFTFIFIQLANDVFTGKYHLLLKAKKQETETNIEKKEKRKKLSSRKFTFAADPQFQCRFYFTKRI